MSSVHGKNTVITVNAQDLSAYIKNSQLERGGDVEDLTPYGVNDHKYGGGLGDHKFTCDGIYETKATATSPKAVLQPLLLTTTTITRKTEGTGVGKPLETFSAVVAKYVETNPAAGFIMWSAEFTVTGAIADTVQ